MKAVRHIAIFVGAAALVCVPRVCLPRYYGAQFRKVAGTATEMRAKEIEAVWNSVSYQSALDGSLDEAVLKRIDWSALDLSELQKTRLKLRVSEIVRYLEKPEFSEYYRLKTEGMHYRFFPTGWASNCLAKANSARQTSGVEPELSQLRLLWAEAHNRGGKEFIPGISAVSLETVAAGISHTNSGQALLSGPVKKGFTVAVEELDPGFQYSSVLNTNDRPLLFELGFVAKSADSGKVGPMHISLLWLEQDETWALNRLIVDLWLGFRTVF